MRRAPRTSAGSTADEIKSYIIEAGLRPGDLMPTESELCAELGVSRSSLREAVRTLASLDIVEVRHGYGTYVGRMSLSPLVNGMLFRLSLEPGGSLNALRDVVSTRISLDWLLAEEIVERHQGRADPELRRLVEGMRRRNEAGESFMEEDRAFHARLLKDITNSVLAELVDAFWEIHTRALPRLGIRPPEDFHRTVEAHEAMIDAAEAGDVTAYRAAVEEHYLPLRRAIEREDGTGAAGGRDALAGATR